LAGGLTFAAAALLSAVAKILRRQSFNTFHKKASDKH